MNGYEHWLENQAVMANAASMVSSENAGRTKAFWESLAESRTVLSARNQLLNHDPRFQYISPSGPQDIGEEQVPIYGDELTKLKGVYSPLPVAIGTWYRNL